MANQTANYHRDVYQWNYTVSPTDDGDAETEYYLPNWTDLVLAGLFTMLIIVTIVSDHVQYIYRDLYVSDGEARALRETTTRYARLRVRKHARVEELLFRTSASQRAIPP